MSAPQDFPPPRLPGHVTRLRLLTYIVLLGECLTRAFVPLFTWVCAFAGLWLMDIVRGAPAGLSVFIGILFALGAAVLLIRGARQVRLPRAAETDRRLQEQSGLKHRPLDDIKDSLAFDGGTPTRHLWGKSRAALPASLARLKLAPPRPVMALVDPAALRIGALLLLIAGIVMAGPAWQSRLRQGVWPYAFSPTGLLATDSASITITPPDYTGHDTIIVKGIHREGQPPLTIPEGSTIKVHVTGGFGTPVLHMDANATPLNALDKRSHVLETTILPGTRLSVTQWFGPRIEWPYQLIGDTEPVITQDGDVIILSRGDIRVPLILRDDYGVQDLQMRMDIDPSVTQRPLGQFYDEIRAVMTAGGKDVKLSPVYDLTFHPWAGLPVRLSFLATDATGQAAILPPIELTLPQRTFRDPVAAQLIEIRKKLIWSPEENPAPLGRALVGIVTNPAAYRGDKGVHLALSTALFRLAYSPGTQTAQALVPLLWDVAVHIEEGDTHRAMRDLQEARENLEAALSNPATTDEELAALVAQLQDAMQNYFQQMAQEMQRRMQDGAAMPLLPPEMLGQMISPQDLEMFFAQLQAQALGGDKHAAREMLSRLSQMMDMLDPSMNTELPEDMKQMMESLNVLQDLIDRQQDLLDETREAAAATPDAQKTSGQHGAQEKIRTDLGGLMQDVGEKTGAVPDTMGSAEQEMRSAAGALKENAAGQAIAHQEEAIRLLKESKNNMSQQLAQRLSQMTGMSMSGPGLRRDPLGRPYGQDNGTNPLLGDKVKIPDESDRKKIEDILQTLRKKSGDMNRPPEELDYYRRLLKQF